MTTMERRTRSEGLHEPEGAVAPYRLRPGQPVTIIGVTEGRMRIDLAAHVPPAMGD